MNPRQMTMRAWRPALLASMTLGAWPGMTAAADADTQRDRALRDIELRLEQQDARREIAERERMQREALRGQEESIRRLEAARQRLESSTREVAELSTELGRSYNYGWPASATVATPRALLGVVVLNRRAEGAVVNQVSPGGAAEEAGIRPGDAIVSLDGKDLTKESDPARALMELMRQVEPDSRVRLEVLRDGAKLALDVTARAPPPGLVAAAGPGIALRFNDMAGAIRSADLLGGMEFATLSEQLGRYFGVTSGVLVVRAGAEAPFSLQDGDVILGIDGRAPTSAQHAGRILRSYQPGEKVKLRVQRDRKAIDIDTTAPGGSSGRGR